MEMFRRAMTPQGLRERRTLQAECSRLDREIARLVEGLASGTASPSPAIVAAVKDREGRRETMRARLDALSAVARMDDQETADRVFVECFEKLILWRKGMKGDTALQRQILRGLLRGRIMFTPTRDGYAFKGEATYGELVGSVNLTLQSPHKHSVKSLHSRNLLRSA